MFRTRDSTAIGTVPRVVYLASFLDKLSCYHIFAHEILLPQHDSIYDFWIRTLIVCWAVSYEISVEYCLARLLWQLCKLSGTPNTTRLKSLYKAGTSTSQIDQLDGNFRKICVRGARHPLCSSIYHVH